jgi:DNA-directed RNA polymerase subunit RPC12/RpoP
MAKADFSDDDPEAMKRIDYHCPNCGHEWEEIWTSACDSTCPECGLKNIEALDWELLPT